MKIEESLTSVTKAETKLDRRKEGRKKEVKKERERERERKKERKKGRCWGASEVDSIHMPQIFGLRNFSHCFAKIIGD